MMKFSTLVSGNQRTKATVVSGPLSSATKAYGSCDVISRDPSAAARPTTALPRYMQDTAVSRQRTIFYNRPAPASNRSNRRALSSTRLTDFDNAAQATVDGRPNILLCSVIVVEGEGAAPKGGGFAGGSAAQNPLKTEALRKRSLNLHRETTDDRCRQVDSLEGPGLGNGGIMIEEVTVPLDLSSSATGVDHRSVSGRFSGSALGVTLALNPPTQVFQQSETESVRLPDICASAAGSLRRVGSELPLIGSLHLQPEREQKQEQPEVESRGTSSSPTDYERDRCASAMSEHQLVGGPSTSGGACPLKRSMPSTTTLSSGSSYNVAANNRRPSKIQSTGFADCLVVPVSNTTTRTDDEVFLRQAPKQSSKQDDRYLPSTSDSVRVSETRQSSMFRSKNGYSAKGTLSPPVGGLSEAALRTLDEIHLVKDTTRVQNNLERFHQTTAVARPTPRLSLPQTRQPPREKKNSLADVGSRQRRPPIIAAPVADTGGNGLMRTSKSQPNLIRHQILQQQHHQQQKSGVRNPVNGSRFARQTQPFKSDDLEDEYYDCDEEDERTQMLKRDRIVQWLLGANECAEPPPCPTVIEEDRPPQTDNAIHIVYMGE